MHCSLRLLLQVVADRAPGVSVPVDDERDGQDTQDEDVGCTSATPAGVLGRLTSNKVGRGAHEVREALDHSPHEGEDAVEDRVDDVEEGLNDGQDGLEDTLRVSLARVVGPTVADRRYASRKNGEIYLDGVEESFDDVGHGGYVV